MSTIYQHALLTISAGLSGHGGGCFCKTPWLGHQKSVEVTPIWAQEFPNEQTVDSTESQDISLRGDIIYRKVCENSPRYVNKTSSYYQPD